MNYTQVRDLQHLKELVADGRYHDFIIQLNGGAISRKVIYEIEPGTYDVFNSIDDTWQTLTDATIMDPKHTHIGEAIQKGAFYMEEPRWPTEQLKKLGHTCAKSNRRLPS